MANLGQSSSVGAPRQGGAPNAAETNQNTENQDTTNQDAINQGGGYQGLINQTPTGVLGETDTNQQSTFDQNLKNQFIQIKGNLGALGEIIQKDGQFYLTKRIIENGHIKRHTIKAINLDTGAVTSRIIANNSVASEDLEHNLTIQNLTIDGDLSIGGIINEYIPTREVWLSPRTDGKSGDGTLRDPFDASTQAKFDAAITALGTQPVSIHLTPGNYYTHGVTMHFGWQISGAGIDRTTVTYTGTTDIGVFSSFQVGDDSASYMRVADLTIDGGATNGDTRYIAGVSLRGRSNNTIERVKVINASAPSNENFIVAINGSGAWNDYGNAIRDCVVENCHGLGCSAFSVAQAVQTGYYDYGAVVERNRAIGTHIGFTSWTTKGLTIRNNYFENVDYGFNFDSGKNYDTVISGNTVNGANNWALVLGGGGPFDRFVIENNDFLTSAVGLRFQGNVTNTVIRKNKIEGTGTSAIQLTGSGNSGFIVEDNDVQAGMSVDQLPTRYVFDTSGLFGSEFSISSSAATNFLVANSGNIGIGTTNPGHWLTVTGSAASEGLEIAAQAPKLFFSDVNGGQQSGQIGFDNGIFDFVNSATRMRINASGGLGIGATYYSTDPGANNVIIEGNVGVGNASPDAMFTLGSNTGSRHGYLRFKGPTINEGNIYHDTTYGLHLDTNGNTLPIRIDGSTLVLGMSGNVGIGTTNPGYKLDVNGNIGNSTGALGIYSGGTNQNISLNPSGTGWVNIAQGSGLSLTAGLGNKMAIFQRQITVGTTLGDYTNIFKYHYTHGMTLNVTVKQGNISAKQYALSITYNATGAQWQKVEPIQSRAFRTSPEGDYDLEVWSSTSDDYIKLRLRKKIAGTATTYDIGVSGNFQSSAIEDDTATIGNDASTLVTYSGSILNPASFYASQVMAKDATGLFLADDGNNGIFIKDGGNVGIGTTDPGYKFDVAGIMRTQAAFGNTSGSPLSSGSLLFGDNNVGVWRAAANSITTEGNYLNLGGYAGIVFTSSSTTIGSQTEVMRITSSNVGIGETSPGSKLSVKGGMTVGNDIAYSQIAAPADGMIIKGSVGIGTTNPLAKLDVTGSISLGDYAGGSNHFVGTRRNDGNFYTTGAYTNYLSYLEGGVAGNYSAGIDFGTNKYGVGGFTAMSIRAGNVGIGTTSPGAQLDIFKNVTALQGGPTLKLTRDVNGYGAAIYEGWSPSNEFLIFGLCGSAGCDPAAAGKEKMVIQSSGNVGIGTTNPGSKLDIRGSNVAGTGAGNLFIGTTNERDADLGGSIALGGAIYTGDPVNLVQFATISGRKEGASNGTANGYLAFGLNTNGTGVIERLRITSSGNVGIGTTNPGLPLAVYSSAGAIFGSDGVGQGDRGATRVLDSKIIMYAGTGSNSSWRSMIYNDYSGVNGGAIRFAPLSGSGDYSTWTPSPTVNFLNNGNVGIGTTSPAALLHLNGTAGKVSLEINSNETTAGSNVLMLRSDVASGDDPIFRVTADGHTYADNAYSSGGADYAEYFYTDDTNLTSGETVCVDIEKPNAVKRCERSGDNNVMGIVSTNPSIVGNNSEKRDNDPHYKIIGMLGQVPAKVSNENGQIQIGDNLTSASFPGYLRKANAGESTVGVAMQSSNETKTTIQVLISRRNQSLTVEKVEEAVTENIANMNIQDQITKMLSAAQDNIAKTQDLASLQTQFSTLQDVQTQNFASLQILQKQMDDLQLQTKPIIDFYLALNLKNMLYKNTLGNFELLDGKITAQDIEALNTIKAKDIEATDSIKGDTLELGKNTTGKNILKAGEVMVKIDTVMANKEAKIYITPVGNTFSQVLYVDEITDGQYFKVKMNEKQSEDINFNWLIVK